jgi:hypothetical protein
MGVAAAAGTSRRRSPLECLNGFIFLQNFLGKLVVKMVLYPSLKREKKWFLNHHSQAMISDQDAFILQ